MTVLMFLMFRTAMLKKRAIGISGVRFLHVGFALPVTHPVASLKL